MNKLFKYLFFGASLVELIRILFEQTFEHYSKPLIIFFLLLYYLTSGVKKGMSFWFIAAALILSWFGDSFLMYQNIDSKYFIYGLLAFLGTHLLYAVINLKLKVSEAENALLPTQKIRHSLTLILAGVALVTILSPNLGEMRLPVTVYTAVIVFMSISALLRYGYTSIRSFSFVFGGAVCFMISDSLLAINKFMETFSLAGFWVMLTYCLAQYLIITGYIQHQKISK